MENFPLLNSLVDWFLEWATPIASHLLSVETLVQLVVIAVLFVPAWLISKAVEPRLEVQVRRIKGMPGLLRFLIAFLRRSELFFYAIFLAIANVLSKAAGYTDLFLIHHASVLTAAWLVINVISQIIRSRTFRRAFVWLAWIYVAAAVFGVVDDVATLLDRFGFDVGTSGRISVLTVLKTTGVLAILLWAASSLGNFLDRRIQGIDELTPSLRVLMGKILRIGLIFLAGIVTLQSFEIDLTALTVLSGAVGVGLGFGLQKVVSNFISGIIILLDQSIKPGDTISLGNTFGWIRELRARFVSVVTRDGREYLIPNEDFITREVINWSFTDKFVRLDVNFGVSYDSDPHEVIRVAIEAASSVDRVDSARKTPVCWMTEFGESSINFKLRFWIDDPQQGLTNIRGRVLLALWDALKEAGINIPYPHREVIFKDRPPTAIPD